MRKPKPTLYLETSVPSYYTARQSSDLVISGHQLITRDWWENHVDKYTVYVSELVQEEAERGDADAAQRRLDAISSFEMISVTQEALDLAAVYLEKLPIPASAEADAVHLALAAVNGIDYLLTWNCRQIARGSIIRSIPAVSAEHGYQSPTICTPEELVYEDAGPEN